MLLEIKYDECETDNPMPTLNAKWCLLTNGNLAMLCLVIIYTLMNFTQELCCSRTHVDLLTDPKYGVVLGHKQEISRRKQFYHHLSGMLTCSLWWGFLIPIGILYPVQRLGVMTDSVRMIIK